VLRHHPQHFGRDLVSSRLCSLDALQTSIHVIAAAVHDRDVFTVHLAAREREAGDTCAAFACPVTDLAAGRGYPFVALERCGHVLSKRALCQVPPARCFRTYAGCALHVNMEAV
jgi:hypothetical protein